jgi:3',5'-cyclic AMP phosphodiesterase CpdA
MKQTRAVLTALGLSLGLAIVGHTQEPALPSAPAAADEPAVLVGAGDIAKCDLIRGAEATAKLLDGIPGTIFTVGDHAYEDGSARSFQACYEPTWGRHKARTRPSPGNHDYRTDNGGPYFDYFGEAAGPDRRGYYSYDLGAWHIVSLNSLVPAGSRSPQTRWLREDLAANPRACTLAYWHAPVFSSGPHGPDPQMREVWRVLYEYGVDVVVNGHDHMYERFARQSPDGRAEPERGIRQFTAGTGGGGVYKIERRLPNSEVSDNSSYGVLKFTLLATSYKWEFLPAIGTFRDAGEESCVQVPPPAPSR